MNYQLPYKLLAWCKRDEDNALILISYGNEYVVAYYRHGASEWYWGHYFGRLDKAFAKFAAKMCDNCVPYLTHLEKERVK